MRRGQLQRELIGNGLTLIREARRRFPVMPVVMLTGYAAPGVQAAVEHQAGAIALLRKPVAIGELARQAATLPGR